MDGTRIGRRHLLGRAAATTGAALAATTVVAPTPVSAGGGPGDDRGVTGGWSTDRVDASIGATAHGIWTFSDGGVVHYQDIFPINAVLHGAWASGPGRTFRFEMWGGLADPVTGDAITARVAGSGTLRRAGTMTAAYTVTLFVGPSESSPVGFQYDGEATATRIVP
jgi:hypothetical protein